MRFPKTDLAGLGGFGCDTLQGKPRVVAYLGVSFFEVMSFLVPFNTTNKGFGLGGDRQNAEHSFRRAIVRSLFRVHAVIPKPKDKRFQAGMNLSWETFWWTYGD